jgi:hypothetical protein
MEFSGAVAQRVLAVLSTTGICLMPVMKFERNRSTGPASCRSDVDSPSPSSVEGCDKVQWDYDIEAKRSGLCDAGDAVNNGIADPACCACTD